MKNKNSKKDILDSSFEQIFDAICSIYERENHNELNLKAEKRKNYYSMHFVDKPIDFRIKISGNDVFLQVRNVWANKLKELNKEFKQERDTWLSFPVYPLSLEEYSELFIEIYNKRFWERDPNGYDCCSKYLECSDAKECVQSYKPIYDACNYRRLLNRGIIYYGKNKTK